LRQKYRYEDPCEKSLKIDTADNRTQLIASARTGDIQTIQELLPVTPPAKKAKRWWKRQKMGTPRVNPDNWIFFEDTVERWSQRATLTSVPYGSGNKDKAIKIKQ
jgi:hypothetical protein